MDPQPNQQNRTRTELAQTARGSASPVDSHVQLTGDMAFRSDGKYACCGSSRETILLNMTSAALTMILNDCFKQDVRWSRYLVIDFSHPWLKSTRQRAKCLTPTVLRPARCAERASVCLPQ